jgi:hypothetical protein
MVGVLLLWALPFDSWIVALEGEIWMPSVGVVGGEATGKPEGLPVPPKSQKERTKPVGVWSSLLLIGLWGWT